MATTKLNLTRDQLASFLQDHEQIKQFEKLFSLVDALQPTTLNDIVIAAGNADQKAVEALDLISSVAQDAAIQSTTAEQKAVEALSLISTVAQDATIQSGAAEQKATQALDALNRIADALELLAAAPVIRNDNSVVTDYVDFNTGAPDSALNVGRLHWNGGYTLNLDMTPNVNQAIGESQYYYIKASGAITKGQLIMFDGSVGSSGVLKGKPATGLTNGQLIMGIAAEDLALNDFGLISSFGVVRGFDTSGTPYGETWADGDILYYNPSFAGGLTKTQPLAPTPHVVVAAVITAASGGSGSVFVRVQAEPLVSQLSDVLITSIANNDLLVYDSVDQRWENKNSITITNLTVNQFAGIGGAGSSSNGLYVRNTALTGSSQIGILSLPTGTSSATSSIRAVVARADTAAATFTVTDVAQFWASDSSKGSGSTITNQYGVYVTDQTSGVNNFGVALTVTANPNKWNIYASGSARNYFAGSVSIGGTDVRATTAGDRHLSIFNGTAPVGTLTNGITIYSSSGEAYVMDAAGNATLFSPHDAETNEWIFRSKHTPTGKVLRIDVERLLRFVNDHFGLDAIQEFIEESP